MSTLEELKEQVIKGKKKKATPLVEQCIAEGVAPQQILDEGLIAALDIVGEKFSAGELFVPEMLVAARTMAACTEILKPHLSAAGSEPAGYGMIATVAGDMHDIGKNLVGLMLRNYGYKVVDLGKDVPAGTIIETALREKASVVGLSALMTTTMMHMKDVIAEAADKHYDGKIIIGGAAVTPSFSDEIGADGYSKDAADCVKLVGRLLA